MTTNLTSDEREQRLKEIRARRGRAMPQATHYINDVGFLLSLIDSEAAGDGVDYKKLARELALIVDVGTSDDPGTALSKLRKIQYDAATAMRDLCVEKVKQHSHCHGDASCTLVSELESLTLDHYGRKQK